MHDSELDELRSRVDCRTVLEQAGWVLDAHESTQHTVKFRDGPAQIIIVTHGGRGWFDPINDQRGDALALAQRLWGGSLGHARKALRPLAGINPTLTPSYGNRALLPPLEAAEVWDRARRLAPGSQAWRYLTERRGLPIEVVQQAEHAGLLREGINGTVWALHRSGVGMPCGWEMRGPHYKGFARGGEKALFWLGKLAEARRVVVTESAIDAMSLAVVEGWPDGTVYVSTGGGFGPRTAEAFRRLLPKRGRLVAATDRGTGGELLAERLHELARTAGLGFGRLRPQAKDWNEQLQGTANSATSAALHGARPEELGETL